MVLEAIRQHDPADWSEDPRAIRRSSVYGLARRCGYPEAHSQQVTRLALSLFDQTQELHGLGSEDRELLEYAAVLHDIGEHVAHEDHHKHAAYLIRYGQLRGFDPEEIHMIGALARWHRGGEPRPLDEFGASLGDRGDERLRMLTAVLRLADGLDRSRSNAVDEVDVRVGPSLVLLRIRATGDSELELWATRRKRPLFEKVFDRELEVTAHPSGRAVLTTV
jgi:exopolyphosphatase/guanosine-5'-triphosphate,3'-diphosphate pyrophosphatase